jgi:hypothetical protein
MGPLIKSANWSCLACVAALFSEAFSFLFLLFSATTTLLSSALDLRVTTRASIAIRSRATIFFFFSASVCFAMTLYACLSSVNTRPLDLVASVGNSYYTTFLYLFITDTRTYFATFPCSV